MNYRISSSKLSELLISSLQLIDHIFVTHGIINVFPICVYNHGSWLVCKRITDIVIMLSLLRKCIKVVNYYTVVIECLKIYLVLSCTSCS